MKRFSKLALIFTCLLLTAAVCLPINASEQSDAISETLTSSLTMTSVSDQTSDSGSKDPEPEIPISDSLFIALYDCIDRGEPIVTYETTEYLSDEYTRSLVVSLLNDYPAFFYLDHISMSYTSYKNPDGTLKSCVYEFKPAYTLSSQEKILEAKADWNQRLASILSIVTPEMNDLEAALVLHDYLCTHFSYDTTLTISNSYQFLKEGTGICEAYAGTYSALLSSLNIPNLFAISVQMNHIWNVVQIDGEWYHIDVTWDDPTNDQPGKALHSAFLRSDIGIQQLQHQNWECKVTCTSEKYDASVFSDLICGVTTDGSYFYAVSKAENAILRCDFRSMTSEVIVDLSPYRWSVWGKPSYWNACFTNVYCDGELLYYSTPTAIEAYDLQSGTRQLICNYEEGNGYLYAMRYENHYLICTVSTKPASSEGEFRFQTRHRYQATADGIFITYTCIECDDSYYTVAPLEGSVFAVCLSSRPTDGMPAAHDLRVSITANKDALYSFNQVEYELRLQMKDGSSQLLLRHSSAESLDDFLIYDELTANGKTYITEEGSILFGFLIRSIQDLSWTGVEFSIINPESNEILYNGFLDYTQLIHS